MVCSTFLPYDKHFRHTQYGASVAKNELTAHMKYVLAVYCQRGSASKIHNNFVQKRPVLVIGRRKKKEMEAGIMNRARGHVAEMFQNYMASCHMTHVTQELEALK